MSLSKEKIESLREDYRNNQLDIADVADHPIQQFRHWFAVALNAGLPEPNAMTLATVADNGRPSARIVLLKSVEDDGFVFYTNYDSQKGKELAQNPYASLVFSWLELQRQVRIDGKVEKVSQEDSLRYFTSRPKGSQIGAWVSPQSKVIADRSVLEKETARLEEKYKDVDVLPLPPNWGGYLLVPDKVEFWQGRTNRLHDRLVYQLQDDKWGINRLAP